MRIKTIYAEHAAGVKSARRRLKSVVCMRLDKRRVTA
jgi:hypothetical protein